MNAKVKAIQDALKNTSNRELALWYFFSWMEGAIIDMNDTKVRVLVANIKLKQETGVFQ